MDIFTNWLKFNSEFFFTYAFLSITRRFYSTFSFRSTSTSLCALLSPKKKRVYLTYSSLTSPHLTCPGHPPLSSMKNTPSSLLSSFVHKVFSCSRHSTKRRENWCCKISSKRREGPQKKRRGEKLTQNNDRWSSFCGNCIWIIRVEWMVKKMGVGINFRRGEKS